MNLYQVLVYGGILFMVLKYMQPVFTKIVGVTSRERLYSDKHPDINKTLMRTRIASSLKQRPSKHTRLVLAGDSKKEDEDAGRVVGLIEDRRVMGITYKSSPFSRKRMLLCPNELVKTTTLNRNLCIKANGIVSIGMGLIDRPVLTEEETEAEKIYTKIIIDYWAYLLEEEKALLILERTAHNVATAGGSSKLDKQILLQAEYLGNGGTDHE